MSDEKRLRKIKWDGTRMQIKYEVGNVNEPDTYTLDCREQPRPAFETAWAKLAEHVLPWVEVDLARSVDEDKFVARCSVRSVSLSYTETQAAGQVMGCSMCVVKQLERGSPWVINTPFKPVKPYDGYGEQSANAEKVLGDRFVQDLKQVEAEVWAYIDGHRAQMRLGEEEAA